jgi:hypothetical protein
MDPETTNAQQLMHKMMAHSIGHGRLFETIYIAEDHMEALVQQRKTSTAIQ